jgi:hypothetical protein
MDGTTAMEGTTLERQKLIETVNSLPNDVLLELASFLDYLHYKSVHLRDSDQPSSSFLRAIAGLGNSGQQDASERDEEILRQEIDPVYGWHLKPSDLNCRELQTTHSLLYKVSIIEPLSRRA